MSSSRRLALLYRLGWEFDEPGRGSRASSGADTGVCLVQNSIQSGLLQTEADFTHAQANVAADVSHWVNGWNVLTANNHTGSTRTPNQQTAIYRGNSRALR